MNKWILMALLALAVCPVYANQGVKWETDFEQAMKSAKQQNKRVLLFFSGSDWCGWTKRLQRDVLQRSQWVDYSNQTYVSVLADFPNFKSISAAQKQANFKLATKYRVAGYPTIVVIDPNTAKEVFRMTGYLRGGPDRAIETMKSKNK